MTDIIVPSLDVREIFDEIRKSANEVLRLQRYRAGAPEGHSDMQIRAVGAYADLVSGGAQLEPAVEWLSFADSLSGGAPEESLRREMASISIRRCPPGGRKIRFGYFPENMIVAEGTDADGTGPTASELSGVEIKPNKELRSFWECTMGEFLDMIDDWNFAAYSADEVSYVLSDDHAIYLAFKIASMNSVMKLFWRADTGGGTPALAHYNGIIKQAETSAAWKRDITGNSAWYATILPAIWENHPLPDAHDRGDMYLWVSHTDYRRIRSLVQSNTQDVRGGYDKTTGKLEFENFIIEGHRHIPGTSGSRRAIATAKPNLNLGLLRESFPVAKSVDHRKGTVMMTCKTPNDAKILNADYVAIVGDNNAWDAIA